MSIGEDRVRTKFNPSANFLIDQLKQKTAELIDLCEGMRKPPTGFAADQRLISLAQTAYEEAAMWAVKAATAPPATPPFDAINT
jgi:hypothetical protein